MIESIFPQAINAANIHLELRDLNIGRDIPAHVRQKMIKHIKDATATVKRYNLPVWANLSQSDSSMESLVMPSPPPTILMRARDAVPSRKGTLIPNLLGWDQYECDLVKAVYEIPGHHFSIFDSSNVRDQFSFYSFILPGEKLTISLD